MKEFFKRNTDYLSPYHPASNGLAERYVQTFKQNFKKMSAGTLQTKLSRFLFHYRNTPQCTTGQTPSEIVMDRRPNTHLQSLIPNLTERVQLKLEEKVRHGVKSSDIYFNDQDAVFVQKYRPRPRWLPAAIAKSTGPVSYHCKLMDSKIVKKHVDQIRPTNVTYAPVSVDIFPKTLMRNRESQQKSTYPRKVMKIQKQTYKMIIVIPNETENKPSFSKEKLPRYINFISFRSQCIFVFCTD